jgi:hypothetical protein
VGRESIGERIFEEVKGKATDWAISAKFQLIIFAMLMIHGRRHRQPSTVGQLTKAAAPRPFNGPAEQKEAVKNICGGGEEEQNRTD